MALPSLADVSSAVRLGLRAWLHQAAIGFFGALGAGCATGSGISSGTGCVLTGR
jgi:hypothetical protein